ncbi:hypothetical protein UFOVP523_19 [uncultured Caudovirales phage]|jgi:hypothetical protein|uniref:Uncharacterized protein n=1 Tax=uncultured Caudovirales phage TaxID=2100421 RepID=A0A6J5MPJ9_9CAUD|nr:hypothetical protein UFOVP523_19 [uncultured Caudovirales phage]
MSERGGKREGSGRKSVDDEKKVSEILSGALKTFYKVDTDNEAKEKLVHTLLESQRGQIFISEHLFGKPKETIDSNVNINNFDIKDIVRIK